MPATTVDAPAASRGLVSGSPRFPCFDGFRAIAATAVLLTHVSFISGFNGTPTWGALFARMDAGVAVFFVISGFLLFRPFVARNLTDRPLPDTAAYARNRILRIYPGYWFVLLFVLVVVGTSGYGVGDLVSQFGLVHVYSAHTYLGPAVGHGARSGHPLDQAWSLGTEISFYLLLPLYAALLARVGRHRSVRERLRIHLWGVVVLALVAPVYRWGVLNSGLSFERASMMLIWLPNYLDQFAIGMALAIASVWWAERPKDDPAWLPALLDRRGAAGVCWLLAGLSFWAVANWAGIPVNSLVYSNGAQFARHELYALTAAFLLLPGVFGSARKGLIRRMLQTRIFVWLGLVSYGVYIWQNVVIDRYIRARHATFFAMSFPVTLAWVAGITVAVATFSYVVVEKPALRLKHRMVRPLPLKPSIG